MPQGYVTLIGRSRQMLAQRLRDLREGRVTASLAEAPDGPAWQRGTPFPDATARPARQEVFGAGDEPLPGYSWPAPRRTGWERRDG